MHLAVEFIYAVGSAVCHQMPERSFFLAGNQLPVCARCAGLYLGGILGVLSWLIWRVVRSWRPVHLVPQQAMRLVLIAGLPTAVTFATGVTGIWDGSNITRALLALPLGLCAGGVVAAVFTKDLR